jgi:hypothetical protein
MLPPEQQQLLDAILERSTVDRRFRQQLLTDPRRAIQEHFGVAIPATFAIRFIERDPDVDALVVLPDFQEPDGALSDRDLESVSGGVDSPW